MKFYNFKNADQEEQMRLAIAKNEKRLKYMDGIKDMITSGTAEKNMNLIKTKFLKALSLPQQKYAKFIIS